jgi:hypothetical protein
MAQSDGNRTEKSSLFNLGPEELAAAGKQRMEEFASAQTALLDKFQTMNQQWLERIQVEANSASEFASKLTAARSIPDAMTACQEWAGQCLEMITEDRKRLLDDYQKCSEIGMRLLSNGLHSNGFGVSA